MRARRFEYEAHGQARVRQQLSLDRLPPHCLLRRARREDSDAIIAFQVRHAMQTELGMHFDRSPDFFALLDAHSPTHETWLLLDDGAIKGVGSIVVRDGYLGGKPEPVAYLGDLRVTPHRIASRIWAAALQRQLAELREQLGVRFAYGCIVRSNRLAHASLLRSRRPDLPGLIHWRGYSNVSILARKPWRSRTHCFQVRRAGPGDEETIRAFLDAESRAQLGGVVFDAPTWRRRLTSWPEFGVERCYLAFDPRGRLVGCLAPWDMRALKRIVLHRMSSGLGLLRHGLNLIAPLLGKPRIGAGASSFLPDVYLTHVAIQGRRSDVLSALLDSAYEDIARTRRYATMSLCLYDADPLWDALRPYWHVAVPMDLYAISLDGAYDERALHGPEFPGFEIYLV